MTKAEERALEAYHHYTAENISEVNTARHFYAKGYEQAEKDILSTIESRLSEIIGDAQPKPALRAELEELIKRIKED